MIFQRGLVVGKFCPLHRGHQLVIDTALRQCGEVIVISYAKPGFPGYDIAKRDRWLAKLYPTVTRLVIDDECMEVWCRSHADAPFKTLPHDDASDEIHRQFCAWVCWDVLGCAVDAVFTSEGYGDGFADSLSRYFQSQNPLAPTVRHIQVDRERRQVPISGTLLRGDLKGHRAFLEDAVYASLIGRAAFLGGESSGKSTMAEAMGRHLGTAHVAEYGRELWEEQGGVLAYEDLLKIGRMQAEREDEACLSADRWLFCDTTPLTTLFYCLEMFGKAEVELEALAQRPYDRLFLCAPDFDFAQDGTRQDPAFRARQHDWYLRELEQRGWLIGC